MLSESRRELLNLENVTGLKLCAEAADVYIVYVVGERSVSRRRWIEKSAGGIRSANANVSIVTGKQIGRAHV